MDRFTAPAGIVLMLTREHNGREQVLLQRRKNTEFANGLMDLSCSGHVEKNETISDTVLRECSEELGICIKKRDIRFVCFIHKKDSNVIYYYFYFVCNKFEGEPVINEPDKCSELKWVDIDNLPDDLIPDRFSAIKAYKEGIVYLEYGWD